CSRASPSPDALRPGQLRLTTHLRGRGDVSSRLSSTCHRLRRVPRGHHRGNFRSVCSSRNLKTRRDYLMSRFRQWRTLEHYWRLGRTPLLLSSRPSARIGSRRTTWDSHLTNRLG